jgi:methanethiol S-methyltransferase
MTIGHLLFSVVITGYIMIGIQLEEPELILQFADQHRRYRQQAVFPLPGRKFIDKDTGV